MLPSIKRKEEKENEKRRFKDKTNSGRSCRG